MSGITQGGLLIFGIVVVLVVAARGARLGREARMRSGDEDSWWWAQRRWWRDGH